MKGDSPLPDASPSAPPRSETLPPIAPARSGPVPIRPSVRRRLPPPDFSFEARRKAGSSCLFLHRVASWASCALAVILSLSLCPSDLMAPV